MKNKTRLIFCTQYIYQKSLLENVLIWKKAYINQSKIQITVQLDSCCTI